MEVSWDTILITSDPSSRFGLAKREIRITRWEDRRDGIVYRIHRYSDGSSWYEQVGRIRSEARKPVAITKRRPRMAKSLMQKQKSRSSKEKGERLENEVFQTISTVLKDRLLVSRHLPVVGSSGEWETDITINEPGHFNSRTRSGTLGPERAVVECKYAGPGVSPGTYVTNLARAYMHLNDLRSKNKDLRLFLVVSRLPEKGESPRDPTVLFNQIGVSFVNFNDETERAKFLSEVAALS